MGAGGRAFKSPRPDQIAGYDGLNRPSGSPAISYVVSGQTVATNSVTYTYDQALNGSSAFKGSLSSVSNTASTTSYTYDGFGRISGSTQTTGSYSPFNFTYGYSLTDALTSITYPSQRQVTYTLGGGDLVAAVNLTGGGSYASNISYTAAGGLSTMTLGSSSPVTQTYTWNDRFQPTGVTAKQGSSTLLGLNFYPCPTNGTTCASTSGTGNNGNVLSQTITMPGLSQLTQAYSYDHLNRLTGAQETGGGANWSQSYGYDTLGNRWVPANSGLSALPTDTPLTQNWYSTTVPNRIASWNYDGDGNVLQEGSVARSFTYDGEDRQVTATIGSGTSTYVYDGLGQRVSKTVSAQTTTYVYDAFGNLAAEYGGDSSACGTCYVTTDHLGSTRLLTNSAGSVSARYDYEPFGQEIGAPYDGRSAPMGYTAMLDDTNPKFTGQMRDYETTLDWFNVRYYSGWQGRFQSPDPGNAGADPSNPQSWNGYAYVNNNPLSYTDPSGMFVEAVGPGTAAGGPVGAIIGAAIDIGEILAGLFGSGLFGGPPPSIPSSLATPSSPILQPSPDFDSQGWNSQVPDGTDADGSTDSGTLFGSGNTGPFVFSAQAGSSGSWLQNIPTIPGWAVNGIAGAGDKFTTIPFTKFSITAWGRRVIPGGDATNTNSSPYRVGGWLGTGYQVLFTSALGGTAAAVADGKKGALFGRGTASVFNTGKVRFGWYWEINRDAIGLRIGAARGTSWYSHIPFWYPK